MADVNVTYSDLENAATYLTNHQDTINQELANLKTYIGNLVTSGFVTDKASVQFEATYTDFNSAATRVISDLTNLATYLRNAGAALNDLDDQLAQKAR